MDVFLRELFLFLKRLWDRYTRGPSNPDDVSIDVTGETTVLIFTARARVTDANKAEIAKGEIVEGRLTLTTTIEGAVTTNVYVALLGNVVTGDDGSATIPIAGLPGDQNTDYSWSFVWIDDQGNESRVPATDSGTLRDTMPPSDPGDAVGIEITGEV